MKRNARPLHLLIRCSRLRVPALVVLCLGGLHLSAAVGGEPTKPLTGRLRLESGRTVDYSVHLSRSAIQAVARIENGVVAATASGIVQRFDLSTKRLVRERTGVPGLTCLARNESGLLLAGFADGRIRRVDPETLETTETAKLPGQVDWIGWRKVEGGEPGLVALTAHAVRDFATDRWIPIKVEPTAVLFDRAGRLWLGADRGEGGGWIARVDPSSGNVEEIAPPPSPDPKIKDFWEGVYGFVELADGEIWAFGGSHHMGLARGEITRIDGAAPRRLFSFVYPEDPLRRQEPKPDQPIMPFTHIFPAEDGGLLVFSYSDVFRVDRTLRSWKPASLLDVDYQWGRRDAVGAYPSVNAVIPPIRKGEPYVLGTNYNGLLLFDGTNAVPLSVQGGFQATDVTEIRDSSEGVLFLSDLPGSAPWRLGAQGWETVPLAPPFEIDSGGEAAPLEMKEKAWTHTQILVGLDGTIHTVSGTDVDEGTRTTARWIDGAAQVLGRQTSALPPDSCFVAPDGSLWSNTEYLRRFENGRWKNVARIIDPPGRLSALTKEGPPWLLLDRGQGLCDLNPGTAGESPRLDWVQTREKGNRLSVKNAIPWSGGILLATDAGVRLFDPATRRLSEFELAPSADAKVKSLDRYVTVSIARDGLGRLWLGCDDGLWLLDDETKSFEPLARVPGLERNGVACLAADPSHEDGVIAALDTDAAVFIRASQKP